MEKYRGVEILLIKDIEAVVTSLGTDLNPPSDLWQPSFFLEADGFVSTLLASQGGKDERKILVFVLKYSLLTLVSVLK